MTTRSACTLTLALAVAGPAAPAPAASHLWRFNEIFSNEDGSVVFIEMKECCGAANEIYLNDKDISSMVTGNEYVFPANLPCTGCTANKYLLLATPGFAVLPGAPEPDYIIEESFFSLGGDTLKYWSYPKATWTYGAGAVPVDGVRSLMRNGTNPINSPTNFAGETGSVVVPCHPADFDLTGAVGFTDLNQLLARWGTCSMCQEDLDFSGSIGLADLSILLNAWGGCD